MKLTIDGHDASTLLEALQEIAEAPDRYWMPVRAFRSEDQEQVDDARLEGVVAMADVARAALGMPEWGTAADAIRKEAKRHATGGAS